MLITIMQTEENEYIAIAYRRAEVRVLVSINHVSVWINLLIKQLSAIIIGVRSAQMTQLPMYNFIYIDLF